MDQEETVALQIATRPAVKVSHLPKRPRIDVEFNDIVYTVPHGRKGSKIILRGVNGLFRAGQLTAILGPSGAGKTTLLNVLAGYKCSGMTGTVSVNDQPRNRNKFRKLSCYIMQDDLVQPHLTVLESMKIAADLKLGSEFSQEQKDTVVDEILDILRLSKCRDTNANCVSGGERKRLSIALELVNNPPVIFLDEPTTGLDNLACSKAVSILKMLASEGRTIVCSIHQPSARLLEMFDHLYVVGDGQCVYQGSANNIVPFLDHLALPCPTHYNPGDYVIELTSGDCGENIEKMVSAIENGRCYSWEKPDSNPIPSDGSRRTRLQNEFLEEIPEMKSSQVSKRDYSFATSGWTQFCILVRRMMLQTWRDSKYLRLKVILHFILGFFVGGVYYNVGNDASKTIFNFGFCFTCIIFFLYIPMMPILLQFPLEVKLLKREYFNRWYGLKSYFLALTIARLPVQLALGTVYITIVYFMSSQPMETRRFIQFLVVCLLVGLVAESIGLAIGSTLNIVNGMFIGPVLTVPLMLFSVYGMGYGIEIPIYLKICMYASYLRYGLEGIVISVYGNNRPAMECPPEEIYCHLRDPQRLLQEVGMTNIVYWIDVIALIGMFLFYRGLGFILLRRRLSSKPSWKALNFIGQFVKSKFSFTQSIK